MPFHRFLTVPALLALTALLAVAQTAPPSPSTARPAPPSTAPRAPADGFVITADSVEGRDGPSGRVAHIESNVTITRGDATLVGRRGIYYERSGLAVIFGDVHGADGTSTIACDTLRYYRHRTAVVAGVQTLLSRTGYGCTCRDT